MKKQHSKFSLYVTALLVAFVVTGVAGIAYAEGDECPNKKKCPKTKVQAVSMETSSSVLVVAYKDEGSCSQKSVNEATDECSGSKCKDKGGKDKQASGCSGGSGDDSKKSYSQNRHNPGRDSFSWPFPSV